MPNIKFSYRYRDSGNYKKFGSVIFDNAGSPLGEPAGTEGVDLVELLSLIRSKLIDGAYFYADEWCLPELFTEYIDFRIDPTWHEFEALELTDEPANTPLALTHFIGLVTRG